MYDTYQNYQSRSVVAVAVADQVVMRADAAFLPMLLDDSSSLKNSLFAFLDNFGGRRLLCLLFDFSVGNFEENFAMINDSIISFVIQRKKVG